MYRWESNHEFSSRKGTSRDNTLNGIWKSKEGKGCLVPIAMNSCVDCDMHVNLTQSCFLRIDGLTEGQISDPRNHVNELCMDGVQPYEGKQHSMIPVGIRSCDILYSHRDGKVRPYV